MKQQLIDGFWNSEPIIQKIAFEKLGKINVYLNDGREIIAPINKFPTIKKLSKDQQKKWYIFGNGFSFDDCNEVFHLEQILGNYLSYKHENLN